MKDLLAQVIQFRNERDWDQFHTPKNLAMALMVEAAELAEHFQWLTPEQSQQLDSRQKERVAEEIADVLIYLVNLADKLDIDLLQAARVKLAQNRKKYPVDQVKGTALKYTQLSGNDEK